MKRTLFSLFAFIALLMFARINVAACSCIQPFENPTLKQELNWHRKNAKAIFTGKVIEIKNFSHSQSTGVIVKMMVERFWKLPVPEEIIITDSGTSCDYSFEVGKSYLVYAFSSSGKNISTNLCSGNKTLQDATQDIKLLGRSKKPQKSKY